MRVAGEVERRECVMGHQSAGSFFERVIGHQGAGW